MSKNTAPASAIQAATPRRSQTAQSTRRRAMMGRIWIPVIVLLGAFAAASFFLLDRDEPAPGEGESAATRPANTVPAAITTQPATEPQGASIADLVTPLAQRLAAAPDNPSDWVLLGKSYDYLGKPQLAVNAYRQAIKYGNSDPAVVDAMNQAQTAASMKAVEGSPAARVPAARLPAARLPAARLPAASIDSWLNAEPTNGEGNDAPAHTGVSGRIALAPELAGAVQAHHTVFVYAQATDGPPMPLAVMRTTAANLPLTYTLDDSMAMMPGHTLTAAKQFVVLARVSASGNATSQPGDLLGRSTAISAGFAGPVNLTIDQVVKQ